MWNSQAFNIELFVNGKARAKIGLQKAAVEVSKSFERKRPAIFLDFMGLFFKFGKHRLPKQSLPDSFDLAIYQIGAHRCIIRLSEKMMSEKLFIKGRGDLGQ